MTKRIILTGSLLSLLTLSYALFLEPNWLEVSHYEVVGNVEHALKIAHLTDLHLHHMGRLEGKVLSALREESPDLVVVTGDTLDSDDSVEAAGAFFHDLTPPLGTWAVLGNWEHWKHQDDVELFHDFHINLLVNQMAQVRKDVTLVGFDDSLAGKPDRSLASLENPAKRFCIALFHSPAFFDELNGLCPLALAGHTHGGQMRLPVIGPLWLPPKSGRYVSGWYESNGARMYVSRGIGTSILPIRFLSRPEIVFITVRSPH